MPGILQNYCGWVNKNIRALLLPVLLLTAITVQSQPVEQLIARASEMQLAQKTAWLNLLHYKTSMTGSLRSQADDARFFLAPEGSVDAQAELEADLRAFFQPSTDHHAQCRFPARLHWLNQQLGFAESLPQPRCDEFDEWKKRFDNSRLTLLFPSMYLNNPASMFGHTFLRFDQKDKKALLNQTLSYAAFHDETDNFLVYSWKGITGGYPGRFLMQPYYETLREYSDIEQRDIWEYTLNLDESETDQLVRHLWEVKGIRFEYFFLRENCSYRLLALLDVAREGVDLSLDSHPVYAVPVDVVRDIDRAGMIAERHYRPARQSRLLQMMQQLGDENGQLAMEVASGSRTPSSLPGEMDVIDQARILRLASELTTVQDSEASQQASFKILSALSETGLKNEQTEFDFVGAPPEQSHATARLQAGVGRYEDREFVELGIRPVFHDSLDPAEGFVKGASVNVMDARLRKYHDEDRVRLQSLDLFSLRSLLPVHAWDRSTSKKLSFELIRRHVTTDSSFPVMKAEAGLGYTVEAGRGLFFVLLDGRLDYATELEDNHGFYIGGEVGGLYELGLGAWSLQFEVNAQGLQSVSGEQGDLLQQTLGVQLNIRPDHALRLSYRRYDDDMLLEVDETALSYLFYF